MTLSGPTFQVSLRADHDAEVFEVRYNPCDSRFYAVSMNNEIMGMEVGFTEGELEFIDGGFDGYLFNPE